MEEKIKEKLKQVLEEEDIEITGEKEEKIVEKTKSKMKEDPGRRKFLKMAGLGVGGLAFSTLASAGFIRNSPGGGGGSSDLSTTLSNGNSAGSNTIDMNQNQIQNLVIDKRSGSDPSSPVEGQIWFRTDL